MTDWGVGGEEGGRVNTQRARCVVVRCVWFELRGEGNRGSREPRSAWRRKLGTGVSTRPPMAWIVLGVDEGDRKVGS